MNISFLDGGGAGWISSPSASGGRSRGRKQDQTASESAAARKAAQTAAMRQASPGVVREIAAESSSSGRRAMLSQVEAASLDFFEPTISVLPLYSIFDGLNWMWLEWRRAAGFISRVSTVSNSHKA
jgi:hypothetical protein